MTKYVKGSPFDRMVQKFKAGKTFEELKEEYSWSSHIDHVLRQAQQEAERNTSDTQAD